MNEYANLTSMSVMTRRNRTGRCFDHVIDGPTLMDMNRERKSFCVETLIPKGVCILGGAPKVGKSWLALDLCIRVAKGEPLWDLPTRKGTTLYLALEDSIDDLQDRAYMLTDDIPCEAHFAVTAEKLNGGLCDQIVSFVMEHPDTVLVVIDTFQVVRSKSSRAGYAGEYAEIRKLKVLADRFGMTILLVHHLRKQGDSDPLNRISGSSALTGATDGVYVLTQKGRNSNDADLICAGRRIRKREMQLRFVNGQWELLADSLGAPDHSLPEELQKLVAFVRAVGMYSGGNAEFAERYNSFAGTDTDAKHLKQLMQQRADDLEQHGVKYLNWRSNGQRLMKIWYEPPQSDDGDDQNAVHESVVPVGTDSPETVTPDVSETVDTIEVEVHPDTTSDQSENSDDRVCDGAAVGTADGSDEMDSGWVDEIRDALGVTLPVCQPDDNGRGEQNGHPLELMKIDTKEVSNG